MRGIVLAGGSRAGFYPLTQVIGKQMLPVYDKPMIYYPLSILMLAGVREILIISTPQHLAQFRELLGDGRRLGCRFAYAEQPRPEGIAQAFLIGRAFLGGGPVALILGDSLFYGHGLPDRLARGAALSRGAMIFASRVRNPERYGVVEFDEEGRPSGLEEKPQRPRSSWAVTGLFFYDERVVEIAAGLKPSRRGELEITDVNSAYLARHELRVERLGRGTAWLDTDTPGSLLQAAHFIEALELRQGLKIACIEEVAYQMGYISAEMLARLAQPFRNDPYGQYLLNVVLNRERPA